MNIYFISLIIVIQLCVLFKKCRLQIAFLLQMPFSQNDAISDFIAYFYEFAES